MERTTFTSKLFATALSIALALFMFVPLPAWADTTEFDTPPVDQAENADTDTGDEAGGNDDATNADTKDESGASGDSTDADESQDTDGDKNDSGETDGASEADKDAIGDNAASSEGGGASALVDSSSASTSTKPTTSWDGDGNQSSPYRIKDADGLLALADSVAGGDNHSDDYFVLTRNIDLSSVSPWKPIGGGAGTTGDDTDDEGGSSASRIAKAANLPTTPATADSESEDDLIESGATTALPPFLGAFAATGTPFAGNFNGNDFTISNLTIDGTAGNQAGLFGTLDDARVENLTLQNVSINDADATDVGALAGSITGSTTVFKVRVASGTVNGNESVGGIAGNASDDSTINNCSNAAKITAASGNAGGIVGSVTGAVSNGSVDISSCENSGTVSAPATSATTGPFGGIAGSAVNSVNITGCTNSAAITANGSVAGGIVGSIDASTGSASPSIIGCRNGDKAVINGGEDGTAGGIVGSVSNAATITKNINTASSISGNQYAAGIVGRFQKTGSTPNFAATNNVSTTSTSAITADHKAQFVYLDDVSASDRGIDISGNTSQAPASFNSVLYATLQYAVNAASDASTVGTAAQPVKLLASVVETVTIPSDGNSIALDLGGNSISQAASADKAAVIVLGALTLTTDGAIGSENASADNPNKVGVLVDGSDASITVNAGIIAGSESAVVLNGSASFIMTGSSTGELISGAAGINIEGSASSSSTRTTSDAEEDEADGGLLGFMSGLFGSRATTASTNAKPTVSLSAGSIVADPVIKVAEGVSPVYDVKGGWYSSPMPANYVAEGYHATLAVNDSATPYTVSNQTVTYTFNSNDGSAVAPIEVDYGTTPTPRTMPAATRDGYVLEGWYVNPDLSGERTLELPAVATENITYYAKWTTNANGVVGGMAKAGDSIALLALLGVVAAIAAAVAVAMKLRKPREDQE